MTDIEPEFTRPQAHAEVTEVEQPYEPPAISVLGSFAELTSGLTGSVSDGTEQRS